MELADCLHALRGGGGCHDGTEEPPPFGGQQKQVSQKAVMSDSSDHDIGDMRTNADAPTSRAHSLKCPIRVYATCRDVDKVPSELLEVFENAIVDLPELLGRLRLDAEDLAFID